MAPREIANVRSFLSRARLSPCPLSSLSDTEMMLMLRRAVGSQEVSAIRTNASYGKSDDEGLELRRLVHAIAAKASQKLKALVDKQHPADGQQQQQS